MLTVTGERFAEQARSEKYIGIKYDKCDCQAFVEAVLRDCGVRTQAGAVWNWKGSNDMWRNALAWKGTIKECRERFGYIPVGAWAFMWANDGGEILRGYHDGLGNASHVGIFCRPNSQKEVRDSTKGAGRDGVGYRKLDDFTHIGLPKVLVFGDSNPSSDTQTDNIDKAKALEALQILTEFVKGC